MRRILATLILFVLPVLMSASSAKPQDKVNREIFEKVSKAVADKVDLPSSELLVEVGKQLLGTPYVASTLEQEPEDLRVYLDKTDCILYVELCTCMTLTFKGLEIVQAGDGENFCVRPEPSVKHARPSYELLCRNIRNMRYRLGVVDGYASRIHYTSEWLLQNQTNGILREFTSELGEQFDQKFNYMSTHPDSYRQLANDPAVCEKIASVEQHIEAQAPFYYISQERLMDPEVMSQIHSGDIITFISPRYGLDLAHVAIACESNGEMHFLHASYGGKKVMLEPKTLAEYAKNGLRISRLTF